MNHLLSIVAIVPAAGLGTRMQSTLPKQYLPLHGRPLLSHTLSRLLTHPRIDEVIVPLHRDDQHFHLLEEASHPKIKTVVGGASRSESVLQGLKLHSDAPHTWALVHDAARPCITHQDLDQLIQHAGTTAQGCLLALPVRDTMKRIQADGQIACTVDREGLWHALTPQLFPWSELRAAIEQAHALHKTITDEASAMELMQHRVSIVPSRFDNLKVTHPCDVRLAELFLKEQEQDL